MRRNENSNIANNPSSDMVEEEKMGIKYSDLDLFPADKIISKMGDNMAASEALIDDTPLPTEKTDELKREPKEYEDEG